MTGNAGVVLDVAGATALRTINASANTGGVTVTAASTLAATITGGAGADKLTAKTGANADTLIGGAGNDTLTSNAGLSTLTGNAGNDVFVVKTAGANLNVYTTITDFSAGDKLTFAAADSGGGTGGVVNFVNAKIVLASTASFADYADAAVVAAGLDDVAWFQFGGDTFVVQDLGADSTTAFLNGTDSIVRLTGTIDLSLLAFSSSALTLA